MRSSSLLEDSQYQPFTGVYETFMLANQDADIRVRLEQLMEAIKRVYASTFSQHAKAYVQRHALPAGRREDGGDPPAGGGRGPRRPLLSRLFRRGALAQLLSGDADARWPTELPRSRWGWDAPWWAAASALTFCPRHPRHLVQFSSVEDILANSQTEFWALELDTAACRQIQPTTCAKSRFGLRCGRGGRHLAGAWAPPTRPTITPSTTG